MFAHCIAFLMLFFGVLQKCAHPTMIAWSLPTIVIVNRRLAHYFVSEH
jgi:hypothetical protein